MRDAPWIGLSQEDYEGIDIDAAEEAEEAYMEQLKDGDED